jgi:hypothetical protein
VLRESLRAGDVHRSFLPVPCRDQGPSLRQFAADLGFSTVIRLPLKSPEARELAEDRLAELFSSPAPLDLFLSRTRRIELSVWRRDDIEDMHTLQRDPRVVHRTDVQRHEHVDLGERGRWFVAVRKVSREQMRAAIDESVAAGLLDAGWQRWSKDTSVAVAAPLDAPDGSCGLYYTHLPMGASAKAPFAGHATGPFTAKC